VYPAWQLPDKVIGPKISAILISFFLTKFVIPAGSAKTFYINLSLGFKKVFYWSHCKNTYFAGLKHNL
jgi:hypothetical protein